MDATAEILIDTLKRLARDHSVDRKTLVCRNRGVGREVLRALALEGGGWLGFERTGPLELAAELVAPELARERLAPADELDLRAVVDSALDRALSDGAGASMRALGEGVGFRDAVAGAVEALRLAGVGPEALEAAELENRDKRAALAQVLRGYVAGLAEAGFVDGADILTRAIARLEADPDALTGRRFLLMPDLRMRGLAGRFVGLLRERGAEVLPAEPILGLAHPPILEAADPSGEAPRLAWLHAVAEAPERSDDDPAIDLFSASSPTDELREVLRRVMASGRPWDAVEIVATDPVAYGCALDALATRLGIPVTYAVGLPIERTRQGRAATAYLRWIQEGFPASILRQLLESGDVRPQEEGAPSSERLAYRLRKLRVGWSRTRYLDTIDRALRWLDEAPEAPADDWRSAEEIAEERARARAELAALRALVAEILDATPAVPDRLGKGGRPISPAELAGGLAAFLAFVPASTPVEVEARVRLLDRLEQIAARLTRETSFGSAVTILRSQLDLRVPSPGTEGPLPWSSAGSAIHLSDLDHGGWTGRPLTFVVGLDADRFPGAGIQDPILLDDDRARLAPGALPTAIERLAERRWDLAALLARLRGSVTLSWSAWSAGESRDVAPASDVLQAFRLKEGNSEHDYEAMQKALAPVSCPIPRAARLDAADVWLGRLAERGILLAGTAQVRAAYPGLAAGLAARDARLAPRLTAHDGRIEPRLDLLDPRRNDRRIVSNSTLEGLGACPLRYFYSKVLRVRPPDDPELDPGAWLTPAERGSLLHDVYEHALRRARDRGVEVADDAFEGVALEVLAEQVDRYRGKVPAPSEIVVRHEVAALEADARSFARHVREDGATWIDVEKVFGYGRDQDPVPLEIGGGTLQMCGRMDRIDERPDGSLVIVDYKSGSTWSYSARFGTWHGGRHVQHLLYTRVAAILYGRPVGGMEYHFPSVKGQNQRVPYAVERLANGDRVLEALCELVARGHFVPTNDADDCKFCDHKKICRVEIDDWNTIDSPPAEWAKAHAEGIEEYAPLLDLRGLDG